MSALWPNLEELTFIIISDTFPLPIPFVKGRLRWRVNSSKFYGSRACLALHVLYLSEVELQWIISGERDIEASSKVLGQRVAVIVEEQWVVTEGRHGYANMCQIVQILQHRDLWIYSKACTCGYWYIWLKTIHVLWIYRPVHNRYSISNSVSIQIHTCINISIAYLA